MSVVYIRLLQTLDIFHHFLQFDSQHILYLHLHVHYKLLSHDALTISHGGAINLEAGHGTRAARLILARVFATRFRCTHYFISARFLFRTGQSQHDICIQYKQELPSFPHTIY